ncbi:cyanamide hydratase, partial [Phenoliferia sp. Uapishka_3]
MNHYSHGFTPVDRNPVHLKPKNPGQAPEISIQHLLNTIPNTHLVRRVVRHLRPTKPILSDPIWNHSHRAYLHAVAIVKGNFPEWDWHDESFFIACLFHDIGAVPANIRATKMSFEFYGAFLARQFLLPNPETASQDEKDLADSVAEAICRHTNFIEGKITTHGQMLQLGTLYDNVGATADWIHPNTAKEIARAYPRLGWTKCFGEAMRDEVVNKPWSHTTFFDEEDIWSKVNGNAIAKPIEDQEDSCFDGGVVP